MRLEGATALVTGANRGVGAAFVRDLLAGGARTVYAGVRDLDTAVEPGAVPLLLDVTRPDQVEAAVTRCGDVDLLVNNAGILHGQALLAAPSTAPGRAEMEVNYFGLLAMCRAFAPPTNGSYATSKAAAWSLTNEVRVELRRQRTLVVGVHAGFIDTDMTSHVTAPKITAETVVRQVREALEAGREEVLADERTRTVKAALARDLELVYPDVQRAWDERPPRPGTEPT